MKFHKLFRIISIILVITMMLSITATAKGKIPADELLPAIMGENYDAGQDGTTIVNAQEQRLADLLARINEFDTFDAQEQAIVLEYFSITSDEQIDTNTIHEIMEAQNHYDSQPQDIKDFVARTEVMNNNAVFSDCSKDDVNTLLGAMHIEESTYDITAGIFTELETRGYDLRESTQIVDIVATGLFTGDEAVELYENYHTDDGGVSPELITGLSQYKSFAAQFNISEQVADAQLSKDKTAIWNKEENKFNTTPADFKSASEYFAEDNSKNTFTAPQDSELFGLDNAKTQTSASKQPWKDADFNDSAADIKLNDNQKAVHEYYTSNVAYEETKRLFIEGYPIQNIIAAFNMGSALMVSPADIISNETYIPENSKELTTKEAFMQRYPCDSDAVKELAGTQDYAELMEVGEYGSVLMSTSSTTQPDPDPIMKVNAPVSVDLNDSESVNLNTGAVNFEQNVVNLPGRNGLDVNLNLIYDSEKADMYTRSYGQGSGDIYSYTVPCTLSCYYYLHNPSIPNSGYQFYGYEIFDETADFTTLDQALLYYNFCVGYNGNVALLDPPITDSIYLTTSWTNETGMYGWTNPWEEHYAYGPNPAPASPWYYTYGGYSGYLVRGATVENYNTGYVFTEQGTRDYWTLDSSYTCDFSGVLSTTLADYVEYETFVAYPTANCDTWYYSTVNAGAANEDYWNLGAGWSFDVPSISGSTIEIPNKGSFSFSGSGSNYTFSDYTLIDMTLVDNTSYTYNGVSSTKKLTFKDGISYYFDSNGRAIAKTDRFGNTIRYIYSTQSSFGNKVLLSKVIDTAGKEIDLTYTSSGTTRQVVVTMPDDTTYTINLNQTENHTHSYSLTSVENQVGATTDFGYETQASVFSFAPWCSSATDYFRLLNSVTYSTGAELEYTYAKATTKFSSDSQEHWRVTQRKYMDGQDAYQLTNFAYTGDYTNYGSSATAYAYQTTVTQDSGVKTVYTFNEKHLLTQKEVRNLADTLLVKVENTYDSYKLPTQTTTTTYSGSFSSSATEKYTYDAKGNILTQTSPLAEGSTSPLYITTYTYDSSYCIPLTKVSTVSVSPITTITVCNTLSADKKTVTMTEVMENSTVKAKTAYQYDAYGNITETRRYPDVSLASYNTVVTTWDNGVMPSSSTILDVRDAAGTPQYGDGEITTSSDYDDMWRLTNVVDGNQNETTYTYDGIGRITGAVLPNGSTKTYEYDDILNTTAYTDEYGQTYVYKYDVFGNHLQTTDASGTVLVQNGYDARGRLAETKNVQNLDSSSVTTYTYDIFDRITSVTVNDRNGDIVSRTTTDYYDVLNANGDSKVVKTVVGDADSPSVETYTISDKYGRKTSEGTLGVTPVEYTYDHLNRIMNKTAYGLDDTYTYDALGNVTAVVNIDGDTTANLYDALNQLIKSWTVKNYALQQANPSSDYATSYVYNTAGRLVLEKAPVEKPGSTIYYSQTTNDYDEVGNILSTVISSGAPGGSVQNTVKLYTYDAMNKLHTATAGGMSTVYTYDAAGKVSTMTIGGATTTYLYDTKGRLFSTTDALGQEETYRYDANDTLIGKTDRNGTVFTYIVDALGRTVSESAESGGVTMLRTTAYNLNGTVAEATQGPITVLREYDSQGRLAKETEGDIEKSYQYNGGNARTAFVLKKNGAVQLSESYTYDTAGRLYEVYENNTLKATYSYDDNGNRASVVYVNGVSETYAYNLANWVTSVTNMTGETQISGYTYTYYLDGNQRTKTGNTGKVTTYTYDDAGRLHTESETGGLTITYGYDSFSNRTSMAVTGTENYTVSYIYDANNRLTIETKTLATTTEKKLYFYDPNGNQTSKVFENLSGGSGTEGYILTHGIVSGEICRYNGFNQLVETEINGGKTTYTYDPAGLRLSKNVNGTATNYVLDGPNVVLESTGSSTTKYIRGINLLYAVSGTTTSYYLYNAHGDVVQLANTSGVMTKTYYYDAFGVEGNPDSADTNPFRYCGEYYDSGSGTYYLRARYYDPTIGRFLSEDTYHGKPTDPLSLNLYTYCEGDPVNAWDPSGHMTNTTVTDGPGKTPKVVIPGLGSVLLTNTQQITLGRLNNIINDHLTISDFSGVKAELQGKPIPKPGGGYWDHITEVKNAETGLKAVQRSLEGSLRNPKLEPQARQELQDAYNLTCKYLQKIADLFKNDDNGPGGSSSGGGSTSSGIPDGSGDVILGNGDVIDMMPILPMPGIPGGNLTWPSLPIRIPLPVF
jgi:RHS repeat-associated protein